MSLKYPEAFYEDHVERILKLSTSLNPQAINNYLMENSDVIVDDYNIVTLAIYLVIKRDLPFGCLQTLLQTFCGDLGILVNGYTLLQTMIFCKKSYHFIKNAIECGLFTNGLSESTNDKVLTILCGETIKLDKNNLKILINNFDLMEYLLSIDEESSINDMIHLSFLWLKFDDLISKHPLMKQLQNLKENREIFENLVLTLDIFGNKNILEGNEYSIRSLLHINARQVAKILIDDNFREALNLKLSNLALFKSLLAEKFNDANSLANQIKNAFKCFQKLPSFNLDSSCQIIDYLSYEDLKNFNNALLV
ncbi:uncharacterized protein LOC122510547 [Leptopilina heterotoma]|uniref:uncharacterized protein LOC122510547 n=1 Tax=Leptopilina heterotoma TaxID=63436 RepID=UPI001CA83A22|nr:uncharacterized protein LOC122510547 [Leptopilina heterotoma]XP_043481234.1 uncharacterized protein LOC122510547 [Leptopilina heterotoma]